MPTPARRSARLALALVALAAAAPAEAQLRSGFRSTLAPRGDDTVTPFADFGFGANIRGFTYTSASACMNGYLSLGLLLDPGACQYPGATGAPTNLGQFAEIYGTAVSVLFRDLNSAPAASGQLGYGAGTVDGRQAFGFTWDGVFTFAGTTPNFFQVLFVNRAADFGAGAFDLEYNYGALGAGAAIAGVADDGGFSGTPYTAAATAAANSRVTQCFRGGSAATCDVPQNIIPEPSTVAMTVVGLGALAGAGLRRRRAA